MSSSSEQRNLWIAAGLSLAVFLGFHYLYEKPKIAQAVVPKERVTPQPDIFIEPPSVLRPLEEALTIDPRISIETPKLKGTLNLRGGRIDDLILKGYHVTPDPKSPEVRLLSPEGTSSPYEIRVGWSSHVQDMPSKTTLWRVASCCQAPNFQLTPETPLVLEWNNAQGIRFQRTLHVDENYLFTIIDRVDNPTSENLDIIPHGDVVRVGTPETSNFFILHEGPIGVLKGKLQEESYADLLKNKKISYETQGGWIGFTDKYWLVSFIPDQQQKVSTQFTGSEPNIYQAHVLYNSQIVAPGKSFEIQHHVFAGAKVLRLLDAYEEKLHFDRFDLAVDFGWFYFVTKPLFYALTFFNEILGNLGLAILVITIGIKALMFPFANKSFKAMGRMKALQPHMEALKARHGDDRMKFNQELMELYRREKVNPASGCLPMLIQGPVFFCLYKVLFVTIEMRHAPFYGWIHDLSAPDPTSFANLFGLIPWTPPSFFAIGIWPLLMGLTMLIQQRINPQPTDPTQAKIMLIRPVFFTYLFAQFPAGLVIYWTWSNLLTLLQQTVLMRQGSTAMVQPIAVKKASKKKGQKSP